MRFRILAVLPLLAALAPRPGTSQVTATVQLGQQNWGPEIRVYQYQRDIDGDWRTSYRNWQPVTLYNRDGHYFARAVPGARPVAMYRWNNQYFLPPRDAGWDNIDRRYRYDRRPVDDDYNLIDRLLGVFGNRPPRTWGSEVVVNAYAPQQYGDWRTSYRRWRPVTLYFRGNRYFSRAVAGSRPVAVYSWNGQYFLPPQDQQWEGYDRRFNYGRRPTADDYTNLQRVPEQYGARPPSEPSPAPSTGYGNEVAVTVYTPQLHGDWRTAYNRWETVTLYSMNGHYYPNQVAGAHSVMLYRMNGQYFLPPRDAQWTNADRRYNYRLRPNDDDYNRTRAARP